MVDELFDAHATDDSHSSTYRFDFRKITHFIIISFTLQNFFFGIRISFVCITRILRYSFVQQILYCIKNVMKCIGSCENNKTNQHIYSSLSKFFFSSSWSSTFTDNVPIFTASYSPFILNNWRSVDLLMHFYNQHCAPFANN